MSTLEKIENAVVEGYKNIENGVVEGYKKVEDKFVDTFIAREGETTEDAKKRITANEHVNVKPYDHEAAMKAQKEMIEKSIEASKNAGKR